MGIVVYGVQVSVVAYELPEVSPTRRTGGADEVTLDFVALGRHLAMPLDNIRILANEQTSIVGTQ